MEKHGEESNLKALLDAGMHFGHQTRRWNPKMKPYIFGSRGDDLYHRPQDNRVYGLDAAYSEVKRIAEKGGTILFVGTKKQAQESIAEAANRCGMPYVNSRWLGGMLHQLRHHPLTCSAHGRARSYGG